MKPKCFQLNVVWNENMLIFNTHTKSNEKVGNRAFEFLYAECCNVE